MFKKLFGNKLGFTLIEMLIVLLIISVLIILIVPSLSNSSKDINEKGCNALLTVVQTQVNLYHLEHGHYPESIDELASKKYITDEQKECSNGEILVLNEEQGLVTKTTN